MMTRQKTKQDKSRTTDQMSKHDDQTKKQSRTSPEQLIKCQNTMTRQKTKQDKSRTTELNTLMKLQLQFTATSNNDSKKAPDLMRKNQQNQKQ